MGSKVVSKALSYEIKDATLPPTLILEKTFLVLGVEEYFSKEQLRSLAKLLASRRVSLSLA